MNEKYKKILEDTFKEVMEALAFMFVESTEKDKLPTGEEKYLHAIMAFSGTLTGNLEIIAGTSLCKLLAANMLGVESQDEESQKKASDALKETLNTICGRYLTALAGEKPVFNLTTPEIAEIDNINWEKIKDNDCFWNDTKDNLHILSLQKWKEVER